MFSVRCAEMVPAPCCGEEKRVIGSRKRKIVRGGGDPRVLVIRRMRCCKCRKIHHELPDCIVPFKRYESECLEHVVSQSEAASTVAADEATLCHLKIGFQEQSTYLLGELRSDRSPFASIRTLWRSHPPLRRLRIQISDTTLGTPLAG